MSETELEKTKARTAEHFENDKNNISWLKEGKSTCCRFLISVKIVLLFISKTLSARRRKKCSSSPNNISTPDFFFSFFGLSGILRVFSIEMLFAFPMLQ